ncbi:fasciclin domain-containing protein [Pseudozobellia thermophila]|uniref:Uncaracterized surface protein containing fasciclin (FAS1) repeats n=1 Tax=Pseudozobellia thermophila TaxID=192903 RepID=A0A1M6F5Z1_9FLAO|nr:fasciclin domain-containing protein [Pseudozobellia thermophila]SHI93117.1 Uncaracterized surface protein containing fasciclin (FAS1) repeats [Pseudozobellia thermophila]
MKLHTRFLVFLFLAVTGITSAQENFSNGGKNSIINTTAHSERHKTLLAVMKATDLEELLDQSGPFTVFAPSDSAFEKLSGKSVEDLMDPENKKELKDLLTYHIVAGNLSASKILKAMCRGRGKATFTTVNGDDITATMEGLDIVLTDGYGNQAKIVVADSNQLNGVIHEIDSVILPQKVRS